MSKQSRLCLFCLYPIVIGILLLVLFFKNQNVVAGTIRHISITDDHPAVIRVALGRITAISFAARPEKVVPGSPGAVEINFLSKDITVRPLSRNPGNLIVYTKDRRVVILLSVVGEGAYDDVVSLSTTGSAHPIRPGKDILHPLTLAIKHQSKEFKETALISQDGSEFVFENEWLIETLSKKSSKCDGCKILKTDSRIRLHCLVSSDLVLTCRTEDGPLSIERGKR